MNDTQDSGAPAAPARSAPPPAASGPWSLAFSGGGIRSATFCLGLARALAKNKLFKHFRILSTVSGGGYVGSAIGRLFSAQANADKVQQSLADDNSLFLWWLRRNGRFLLPAGAADALQGAAGYLRSLIATHWEVGVLAGLLSTITVLPHLLMGLGPAPHDFGTLLGTPWWSMLLFLLLPSAMLYFAFWFTREAASGLGRLADILITLLTSIATVLGTIYLADGQDQGMWPPSQATTAALMIAAGVPLGFVLSRLPFVGTPRDAHILFTRGLSCMLFAAAALGALGLLDLLSWSAARELSTGTGEYLFGGLGLTVTLLLGLRAAIPALQKLAPVGSHPLFSAEALAHVLGLLLSFALLFFWMTAMQWWVYFGPALKFLPLADHDPDTLRWVRWGAALTVLCLYVLLSGRNLEQLNRASLYPFYSSRIARAYVSVGNVGASGRFKQAPTDSAPENAGSMVEKVSDFMEGDDIKMSEYGPDQHDGPLHLINVCINQTRDDDTGVYNADRKGINLAVSHKGFEFGTKDAEHDDWLGDTTLAQWAAISGAAMATGMGSRTRTGVAALSFLTGVRLGYWWGRGAKIHWPAKYRATLNEWFGRFPGQQHPPFYLSDGGHYDNTGVYALLKRRPALIVAADCGADPSYTFADIENLVRKARIDYRATIEFLDPRKIDNRGLPHPLPLEYFGTPDSIGPKPGAEHLLLARITYDDSSIGALLVVKPRRVTMLNVDVAGYSDRDPAFPQQSTGDQFFDEAQWESYCELGLRLGKVLDAVLFEAALAAVLRPDAPLAETRSLEAKSNEPVTNDSRRERISLTTGQKVGVGAALSALVAGWPILQETQKRAEESHQLKQIAIQKLLNRETPQEESLIDKVLGIARNSNNDDQIKSFQNLVERLDNFGTTYGSAAQDSAIRAAAETVANHCQSLAAQNTKNASSQSVDEHCITVLAALTQARRSIWARSLAGYQKEGRRSPDTALQACTRGSPTTLALRTYDQQAQPQVEQLVIFVREHGYHAEHRYEPLLAKYDRTIRGPDVALSPAIDKQGTTAEQQTRPDVEGLERQAWLLVHHSDEECANYFKYEFDNLSKKSDKPLNFTTRVIPSLAYGQGEMQLVLAPPPERSEAAPPASATSDKPPPPPDESDFSGHRKVYVQFRGSFTREQVNNLREALKTPLAADQAPRNAYVPDAERVAGTYGNSVRYFNDDAKDDAEWLAKWVGWYFKDSGKAKGCSLTPEVVPLLKPKAKGNPPHLEIWIAPNC